jgi:hypothetical protein
MAQYKFERFLHFCSDKVLDTVTPAGAIAPRSGIYRCDGCGMELTALADQPLPNIGHHEHAASQKLIRWKLIVADAGAPSAAQPGASASSTVFHGKRF